MSGSSAVTRALMPCAVVLTIQTFQARTQSISRKIIDPPGPSSQPLWPSSNKVCLAVDFPIAVVQLLTTTVLFPDKKRTNKGLFTSHGSGYPVTLKNLPSAFVEAAYIAEEIKRLIAHSGNMLGHDDFAILRKLVLNRHQYEV